MNKLFIVWVDKVCYCLGGQTMSNKNNQNTNNEREDRKHGKIKTR